MPFQSSLRAFTACALASFSSVHAQDFDPSAYRDDVAGEPTQVLVLGTPHLATLSDDWDPSFLAPLMERLVAYDPDVITTEVLPGRLVHQVLAYEETYPGAAEYFASHLIEAAEAAELSVGMDMPEARAAADAMLRDWPDEPTPEQRRALAARLAAAGDAYSALVQWLRLPENERVASGDVSEALVEELDAFAAGRSESVLIAARLAAELGLERVFATDHQTWEGLSPDQSKVFYGDYFSAAGERIRADALMQENVGKTAEMTSPEATLDAYRFFNDPNVNRRSADLEWGGYLATPSEEDVTRRRVAGWDMRNLRMAANIREASSYAPGGRVLVVVGASHKIWLEAYLAMVGDIEIVSTEAILE